MMAFVGRVSPGSAQPSLCKLCRRDFLGPNVLNLSNFVTTTCEHQFLRVLTAKRNLVSSQNKDRHVL